MVISPYKAVFLTIIFVALLFAANLFLFYLLPAWFSLGPYHPWTSEELYKLLMSLGFLFGLGVMLILAGRGRKFGFIKPLKRPAWYCFLLLLALPLSTQILLSEFRIWSRVLLPFPEEYARLMNALNPTGGFWDMVGAYWTLALIGPICEEMFFRGVLLPGLVRHFRSQWNAILLVALLFGLAHLNPFQTLYAIPMGILFGFVRWQSGSLAGALLLHVGSNLLAILAFYHLPDIPFLHQREFADMEHPPLWMLGAALALFCLAIQSITSANPHIQSENIK